jgi:KOW motif
MDFSINPIDSPKIRHEGLSILDIPANMRAGLLNKICAHPIMIAWVLGALVLNVLVIGSIIHETSFSIISDWKTDLLLMLAAVLISGFGLYAGLFACGPFIFIVCKKFNGAPLKVGDHVIILAGPQKGATAKVYEIITGQGGQKLARLDLGDERAEKFRDIFEQYSVLKIQGDQRI